MNLSERAEEALEMLWIATQEDQHRAVSPDELGRREREALSSAGLITVLEDRITLTETGLPEARGVVRRHRLAERLLNDVLGAKERLVHAQACKFEHLLDRGLDDNICTLLGHPKVCPHSKPIPPGKCCQEEHASAGKLVSPLSELAPGYQGKVAYIHAPEAGKLQKLIAMGILPGASIKVLQRFPSFVFEAGHSQFAVDEKIAEAIYVRQVGRDAFTASASTTGHRLRRRRGLLSRLW